MPGVPRKEAGAAAEQANEVEGFRLSKLLASAQICEASDGALEFHEGV